jgi:eukaryotic-like serine/threonine-protein kinase
MIKQINHFKLICELGRGGSGIVYKALDTRLKRYVAIKILNPRPDFRNRDIGRFLLEAQAASSLNHPNICTIFDIGKHNKNNYIVMELVEGKTLRQIIEERKKLPSNEMIEIAIQVCQALSVAHKNDIIHRDIKPDNILITKDNHVKITDFGLAKLKEIESDSNKQIDEEALLKNVSFKTSITTFLGTVAYMSPEQIEKKQVDERSDIFSLGIVMFELLMGLSPFSGTTNVQIMQSILNTDVKQKLTSTSKKFNKINRVIQKSLEKEKTNRYQKVNNIITDLENIKTNRKKFKFSYIILGLSVFLFAIFILINTIWKSGANDLNISSPISSSSIYPLGITHQYHGGYTTFPVFYPDDKAILFTMPNKDGYRNSLYKKDLRIGNAILIAERSSFSIPDLNPDGSLLAYYKQDGIYISDINLENHRKITEFGWRPRWSPNGDKIVFSKYGSEFPGFENNIFISDLGGNNVTKISPDNGINYADADWSTDGKWIVCCGGMGSTWEIWLINISSGFAKQITNFGEWITCPEWDPSGNYIYYLCGGFGQNNIYKIAIDNNQNITYDEPFQFTNITNVLSFNLSHNGNKIVFVSLDEKYSICRIKLSFNTKTLEKSETIFFNAGCIENFEISPSENMIVIEALNSGIRSLFLKSIDSQKQEILYNEQNSFSPSWSFDGKWIAFDAGGGDNADILRVNIDNGQVEKVVENRGADWAPSFSPNGNYMCFLSNRSGQFDLWLMDMKSKKTTPITNTPELESRVSWSHDSKKIAFFVIADKIKNSSLWIYDFYTKKFTELSAIKRYPIDLIKPSLGINSRVLWNEKNTGLIFLSHYNGIVVELNLKSNTIKPILHFDNTKIRPSSISCYAISGNYFYYLSNESKQELWMLDGLSRKTVENN